jgi:hypothetical protein
MFDVFKGERCKTMLIASLCGVIFASMTYLCIDKLDRENRINGGMQLHQGGGVLQQQDVSQPTIAPGSLVSLETFSP